jgi:hypothetical protein
MVSCLKGRTKDRCVASMRVRVLVDVFTVDRSGYSSVWVYGLTFGVNYPRAQ